MRFTQICLLRGFVLLAVLMLSACANPLGDSRLQGTLTANGNTGCTGALVTTTAVGYMPVADCFVSRASTARYTDSAGVIQTAAINLVRVDYHPTTHALNGFLIEPAATNIVPNTTDFSTLAKWSLNGAPTFNQTTTAPDGSTAFSFASNAAFIGVFKNIAVTVSTTYTMSVYTKYVSGNNAVRFGFSNGIIDVNSQTGAITFSQNMVGAPSCTSVGNGWFRCVFSTTTPAAGATAAGYMYNRNNAAAENAFWGPQIEAGTTATSYIPTSNGAVTRAADIYQLP